MNCHLYRARRPLVLDQGPSGAAVDSCPFMCRCQACEALARLDELDERKFHEAQVIGIDEVCLPALAARCSLLVEGVQPPPLPLPRLARPRIGAILSGPAGLLREGR